MRHPLFIFAAVFLGLLLLRATGNFWVAAMALGFLLPAALTVMAFLGSRRAGPPPRRPDPAFRLKFAGEVRGYRGELSAVMMACMGKFAKLDGIVTHDEIAAMERVFTLLGYNGGQRARAIEVFNRAKNAPMPFADCVELFRQLFEARVARDPGTQRLHFLLLKGLLILAQANRKQGRLARRMEWELRNACVTLGFNYEQFAGGDSGASDEGPRKEGGPEPQKPQNAHRQRQGQQQQWRQSGPSAPPRATEAGGSSPWQVLGCEPSDSVETIKENYRALVKKFHPDTIAAKGLPEEFTQFAEEKFKQIQAAYETVMAQRAKSADP